MIALMVALAVMAQGSLTPNQAKGRELYNATCNYCHGPRGFGTEAMAARLSPAQSILDQRTDLTSDYIRAVVKGGFNNMPAYTPTDLSEAELAAIVEYLMRDRPR